MAAIVAAGCAAGCEEAAEPPPPVLWDKVGLFEPMQVSRLETLLGQLRERHGLAIIIRGKSGAPLPEQEGLGRYGAEVLALEFYPHARLLQIRTHSVGGIAGTLDRSWPARLQSRVKSVWDTPGRVGDVLEVWLRALVQSMDPRSESEQSLLPEEQLDEQNERVDPADVVWSRHSRPPRWNELATESDDPRAAQATPQEAYAALMEVARRALIDSSLKLYTQRSRVNFQRHPLTTGQLLNMHKKYSNSAYELAVHEDRAVVHFPNQPRDYIPFFFASSEEGWQVDFYTSAKVTELEVGAKWRFLDTDHPYMFAFSHYWVDEVGYVLYEDGPRQ